MFIQLGLLNSFRQVGRSLLAVLAMTLAALSLSAALSYDDGIVRSSYQLHRELIGGEILVSRIGWFGQKSDETIGSEKVTHQVLQRTGLNRLETFTQSFIVTASSLRVMATASRGLRPQSWSSFAHSQTSLELPSSNSYR